MKFRKMSSLWHKATNPFWHPTIAGDPSVLPVLNFWRGMLLSSEYSVKALQISQKYHEEPFFHGKVTNIILTTLNNWAVIYTSADSSTCTLMYIIFH
jgi:hypothetical protein